MKIFREVIIIFGLYYIGEWISKFFHLPLPGSLVGMLLLLILLMFHVVKLEGIASVSNFLLSHLPFFFIPAGVALMTSFFHIKDIWFIIVFICILTTVFTMGITGWTIQKLMDRGER